ncbi:MAG: iron ABC transporter permease [Alphaproteobacteria bacterium]|nr:iron ABC transporter permease [Alphaproteobacteria bacterium]
MTLDATAQSSKGLSILQRYDPSTLLIFFIVFSLSLLILAFPIIIFWLSFRIGRPIDPSASYSFDHYIKVFSDPFVYKVLLNTLGFALTTLVVSLSFGLLCAWLVERTNLPGKSILYTLMTIGLLLPGFATAMGWLFLMHPRIGVINAWMKSLLGIDFPLFNITSIIGMGWVEGLSLTPVAFIMTAAVFRSMDVSLEDSAQMSGANFSTIVRRITLPLAWPGILAAGIYIFTIGFATFDVPAIIGWSNRIFTFSTYLVTQLSPDDGLPQYGPATALSTFVIFMAGGLSLWYGRLQSRAHRYQIVTGKGYRPRLIELGRAAPLAWLFLISYFLLSKLIPLLIVIWASILPYFQPPSLEALSLLTMKHFNSLPWTLVLEGLKNTTILVFLTPTITLICAIAFSWLVLRSKVPGRGFFDFVAFLPHAIPNIVFGIGVLLFALFVMRGIAPIFGTIWILLIIFVVGRLSYATRMTNGTMMQIHKDLEESAQMSGAGTGTILSRIIGPLLRPTLIYAWLWIALITFRELTLAVLLTTRDNMTLPVVVWSLWVASGFGQAAALTLILLVIMIPIVWLYWWVARKMSLSQTG